MKCVLLAILFVVLQANAKAELIRGEISGNLESAVGWNHGRVGDPFLFKFTIDTVPLPNLKVLIKDMELWINNSPLFLRDDIDFNPRAIYPVNGPGLSTDAYRYRPMLEEDTIVGSWGLGGTDAFFWLELSIPGVLDDPITSESFANLTRASITGVSIGLGVNSGEAYHTNVPPSWIGRNLPVPEPPSDVLALLAVVVVGFRLKLARMAMRKA